MLTHEQIEDAKGRGTLIPARPIVPWAGEPRAFLMCRPLFDSIEAGRRSEEEKERQRWARLEASISFFIEGGWVTDDLVKQLQPPKYEHWELRCRKPRPSLRVFARFGQPDVLIGTHVMRREELGGMGSPEFEHQMLVCEEIWNDAGLGDPYTDSPKFRYSKYITTNAQKKNRVPR